MYEVLELKEKVEVCVITCNDIGDEIIEVRVIGDDNILQIPPGSALASKRSSNYANRGACTWNTLTRY